MTTEFDRAFETLYATYAREMYWVGMSLCRDTFMAEEAVQEVFAQLWEQGVDPVSIRSPHSYLATLIRHRILDQMRHRTVVQSHEERIRYEIESDELEGLSSEELHEMLSRARALVQSLPEGCREIFLMATMEGMKYAEIAERKGISINTVKTQLRIAKKRLRSADPDVVIGLVLLFGTFI